jgi:hypothetical protein
MLIEAQQHPHRKILTSKLSALKVKTWMKKLDMYSDLIRAIRDGLYKEMKDILVVDTSQHNDFHADISVAKYDDARLPYSIWYFLELKLRSVEPRTAAHYGQMLDYFKSLHEKQPHRSRFIGSYQTISLPGSTTLCLILMRKARKLRSIRARLLQMPSSSLKHCLPHSCKRRFPCSIKH